MALNLPFRQIQISSNYGCFFQLRNEDHQGLDEVDRCRRLLAGRRPEGEGPLSRSIRTLLNLLQLFPIGGRPLKPDTFQDCYLSGL